MSDDNPFAGKRINVVTDTPAAPTTQEWPNPDACCSRNAFEDDAHSRTCENYLTSLEPGQVRVQGFDRFWSRLKERFDGR